MSDEHLTALDATFLELEEVDSSAHMHIGGVMIFEPPPGGRGAPPLERVRADVAARLSALPRFGQRLSERRTHGLSWPRWVDDERFDIARHVRRATLQAPAGEEELLEWAGGFYSQRLDRTYPLWEIVVLELADGRWAIATKTHHCMVDGVGSVEIGHTLLDVEPEPDRQPEPAPPSDPAPSPEPPQQGVARRLFGTPLQLASSGLSAIERGASAARGLLRAAGTGAEVAAGTAIHPRRARDALRRSRAMAELLVRDELIAAPRTSLNEPIGPRRRLAVRAVALDELKEIKQELGGTINDVVLASAAGGLRRLFAARGEGPPGQGLRAMVPVNIRGAADRLGTGNRITSLFIHLPVAEPDPLRRYHLQLGEAESLKAGTQAVGSRGLVDLTSLAPPVLHTFLARSLYATRLFNVTITNVPGPQQPLYAFGSRMRAVWPLVPLAAEHGFALAVFSYDGQLFFCINADRDAIPEVEIVADGLVEEVATLLELADGARRAANRAAPAAR